MINYRKERRASEMGEMDDFTVGTNPYRLAWHITPEGRSRNLHKNEVRWHYRVIKVGVGIFFTSLAILYLFL